MAAEAYGAAMSRPDYYVERYPMELRTQPKTRELEYNQARCPNCPRVVKGRITSPRRGAPAVMKFECHCGNKWDLLLSSLAPVAANGNGKLKEATCPECGHHFALTANG